VFIVSLFGVHAWIVGIFEPKAQAEVFRDAADAVASNLSIGVRRRNAAERTPDGFIVSGKWSYGSGIDFAEWVIVAVNVPAGAGGFEERLALVPSRDFAVDEDSWNVSTWLTRLFSATPTKRMTPARIWAWRSRRAIAPTRRCSPSGARGGRTLVFRARRQPAPGGHRH
jgi:hypothetical protein